MTTPPPSSQRPLVLLGAGGHARVLLAMVRANGYSLLGVCDPALKAKGEKDWEGIPVLGDDDALLQIGPDKAGLVLGVGQLAYSFSRAKLYEVWTQRGYAFPPLVHPNAWVSPDVKLSDGLQIMAGAVVQPGCIFGNNIIVNTKASVDHDCNIGNNVHISPGAILCGSVTVGTGAFIGAGAVVIPNLHVANGAVIGAGVTLTRNVQTGTTVFGPANRDNTANPELSKSGRKAQE